MKKFKGNVNLSVGKAKQVLGHSFNDKKLENKGFIQEEKGRIQKIEADFKKRLRIAAFRVGSTFEKMGDKISHFAD